MAIYRYSSPDNSTVMNTVTGFNIPVAGPGYMSDAYQAWRSAGNTPDAYIAQAVPSPGVVQIMPVSYTISTVPSALSNSNAIISINDLPEGQRNCWSDGTNWRRISDDTIVV